MKAIYYEVKYSLEDKSTRRTGCYMVILKSFVSSPLFFFKHTKISVKPYNSFKTFGETDIEVLYDISFDILSISRSSFVIIFI